MCELKLGVYGSGNLLVVLCFGGHRIADISVIINDSHHTLKEDEFFFNRKKYSLIEDDIYSSGLFEHTGKVEVSGYHTFPIWRCMKKMLSAKA